MLTLTGRLDIYHISAGEYDGQPEGGHHDACGQEYGQLFAGVAGRVCFVHHAASDAVWDRTQNVEEEQEQRPVRTAHRHSVNRRSAGVYSGLYKRETHSLIDGQSTAQHEEHQTDRSSKRQTDQS